MSFDDTVCPCGDRKQPQTMLCTACCDHLRDRPEMARFTAATESTQSRRHDAIILLALARGRKRRMTERTTTKG